MRAAKSCDKISFVQTTRDLTNSGEKSLLPQGEKSSPATAYVKQPKKKDRVIFGYEIS